MEPSFIGICCICKCEVNENTKNNREVDSVAGFHKNVLCGKASCNKKYTQRIKKRGYKEFKTSLGGMHPEKIKKSLLDHGRQEKGLSHFTRLEKTKQVLLKKLALTIETGDKSAFKVHLEEIKDLIAKLDEAKYKLKVVDYFIEKIHDRMCFRFGIRKDDPLPTDQNPCNILYHEIRRKMESFISPAFDTGSRTYVFDDNHPCYDWLF